MCVDEIAVDEDNIDIKLAEQTVEGPTQIESMNPFDVIQAETTFATHGVKFEETPGAGDMVALTTSSSAMWRRSTRLLWRW